MVLTEALACCRYSLALILAAAAGADHFARVRDAFLERRQSVANAIVGAVSRQEWNDSMVEEWPLNDWRTVLTCVIA
jgi:hypothetical protein